MEHYSAIKRNEIGSFVETWMDLETDTERSKSEREKQISYINAYMWNLKKWFRWTGLQGRNRDTDVENKRMDFKGGKWRGGGVMNWEIGIDIYTVICIKCITNKKLLYKKINKIKFKIKRKSICQSSILQVACPELFHPPATLLFDYKSPPILAVFRVEPCLSLLLL